MCTCQGEHRPAPLKLRAADALQVLQEGEHKETELRNNDANEGGGIVWKGLTTCLLI